MAFAKKLKSWFTAKTENPNNDEIEKALLQKIQELERSTGSPSGHRFHVKRYVETFRLLPKQPPGELLDLGGAYGIFSDLLTDFTSHKLTLADRYGDGDIICFDSERDIFPFQDNHFDIVLFTEVIEHFSVDPMHAISEINRILKPGGKLLLSTPNICSWKSIHRALAGEQPGLFVQYMRHGGTDRHNREYTANEIKQLVQDAGFDATKLEAIDVYDHLPTAELISGWPQELRGDTTFCLATKISPTKKRMPNWLYWPNDPNS